MNYKKIILITLLLLVCIMIGTVNAEDNSDNITVHTVEDDQIISSPVNDGDLLSDDDPDRNEDSSDDENENYLEIRPAININSDDEVITIYDMPKTGNFTVTVKNSSETYEINHQINNFDKLINRIGFKLKDLQITKYGTYKINITYISPENNKTEYCRDHNLSVMCNITQNVQEFDLNTKNAEIITISCPEGVNGTFIVGYWDDNDDFINITNKSVNSSGTFNWTLNDLGFDEPDTYYFDIYFLKSDAEESDFLAGYELEVYNSSEFRVKFTYDSYEFLNNTIVSVFCPAGSEDDIHLNMTGEDDSFKNFTKAVSPNNWVNWTQQELGMESDTDYQFIVYANNEIIYRDDDETMKVYGVFRYLADLVYLESDDENRILIFEALLSSNITNATINIKLINGTEVFNENISAFVENGDTNILYWHYLINYGHLNEDAKSYCINILNINKTLQAGKYNMTVTINANGTTLSRSGNITIAKPNSKTKDNVSITIYDSQSYYFKDHEEAFIQITTDEEINATVVITIAGNDTWNWSYNLSDIEDGIITPNNLNLAVGTYNLTVAINNESGNQILNNTAFITLTYSEDGIMMAEIDEYIYLDSEIRIRFDEDEFSGNITIKLNGTEYFKKHITSSDCEFDKEGLEFRVTYIVKPENLGKFEFGTYNVEVSYFGDDGLNGTYISKNIHFLPYEPNIYITYSDWDKQQAEFSLYDDELVIISPNGDNISSIRIIIKIGDEVYLNSTLVDLGLKYKIDWEGNLYYSVGPVNFNKTVELGHHYENVVAYYYSDNFNKTSEPEEGDDDNPGFFDIVGMIDEIDYRNIKTNTTVLSILCNNGTNKIKIIIRNVSNWDTIFEYYNDTKTFDNNTFLYFNSTALNLTDIGEYYCEIYVNGNWMDNTFYVVNNSAFHVKTKCDTLFTADNVFFVYCPVGSTGNITINNVTKSVSNGTYVGFTLKELGINSTGDYDINVSINNTSIGIYGLYVPSNMEFNRNTVVVIGNETDNLMRIVSFKLPVDENGTVTVSIDGVEKTFNLTELTVDHWGSTNYYTIYISNVTQSEGKHKVIVTYKGISESRILSFNKRNINVSGDISLEMFSSVIDVHDSWDNEIAIVRIGNETYKENINITVILNNTEYNIDVNDVWIEEIGDENNITYVYHIYYDNLNIESLRTGMKYNIAVVVKYNENKFINNNDTIKLTISPYVSVMYTDWDTRTAEYYLNNPETRVIHINCFGENISTVRVILMNGSTVLLNGTIDKFYYYYDESEDSYQLNITNLRNIKYGHYDDVIAYLYTEDYEVKSTDWDDACTSFDIYGNSSIELNNIEYEYDNLNGSTTVNLTGSTIDINNITVNNTNAKITYENGIITVSNLSVGNYTLTIKTTPENKYYYSIEKTVNITVKASKSTVEINNIAFIEGENGNTTVNVHGGNITKDNIKINNTNANITYKNGIITVSNLTEGKYNLNVTTTPDENHTSVTVSINITVSKTKINPDFKINISDVSVGSPVIINVTAHESFNGNVTISLTKDKNITITIKNGFGSNSTSLKAGDYNAVLNYTGSNVFNESYVNKTFKVSVVPVDPNLNISTNTSFDFGKPITINITTNTTFNGTITVTLDKTDQINIVNITNGVGSTTFNNLKPGEYTAIAKFNATEYFTESVKNTTFKIYANSSVELNNIEYEYDNLNGSTTVNLTNATIDETNITVNNTNAIITYKNGTITVSNLPAGNYTLTVKTTPTEYYYSVKKTVNITVKASKSSVEIKNIAFIEGGSGNTTVIVHGGNITKDNIKINNTNANITYKNGIITVSNLTEGKYSLNVTTTPDENHTSVTVSINITVSKTRINPDFKINIGVLAGSPVIINVTAHESFNGNVTINIGDENISITIKNGFGSNSTSLEPGDYNAILNYTGDSVFNESYVNKTFKVHKSVDPNLNISTNSSFDFGKPITITIKTNTTFTGNITVTINETKQTNIVNIVNGLGSTTFNNLNSGEYTVIAKFKATEIFNESVKNTTFKINKINPQLNVNIPPVYNGSAIIINISTNSLFSGDVTVKTGKENKTVHITNGSGIIDLTGYDVGSYKINVIINETINFNADTITSTAVVKQKLTPNFVIIINNTIEGEPIVVKVIENNKFNGTVIVNIDNYNVTVNISNGVGINNTNIVLGAKDGYEANLTFDGDNIFNPSNATTTFNVTAKPKINPDFHIAIDSVVEGNPVIIKVTANSEFTGDVTITIGSTNIPITINSGYGELIVSNMPAGTYHATLNFAGNDRFNPGTTDTTFNIAAKQTPKKNVISLKLQKVTIKKSAKKLIIKATLKINNKKAKNKKITFKFNGKKYKNIKTNKKGVAKLTIKRNILKKLKIGKKITYTATYSSKTTKQTVKVKK